MLNRNFKLAITGLVSSVTLLAGLTISAQAFAATASDSPKLEYVASPQPDSSNRNQSGYHGNNNHNDHNQHNGGHHNNQNQHHGGHHNDQNQHHGGHNQHHGEHNQHNGNRR